ncbi:SDR family NAD(P)-dependent oxidoreductase [Amnibacterium flavum]|uniref:Oxidoreductase n=1 Tax=Amnibacterium flavum TaxID=2173173 RepID=A0A2V1HNB2_9MICO|nr:SDR family oxidoreductase [Amnibacterium flavum]PVZ93891.1 oxidoreductase [Amnibacterium flavum]
MGKLTGKVALVSGAAQGMGRATAELLADEGAIVYGGDVVQPTDAEGSPVRFVHLDVADEASWAQVVSGIESDSGRLDVLVNNAGVIAYEPILETTLESWNRVMSVDLTGIFLGMRESIPLMRDSGGGSIINFSSIWGLAAVSGAHAYHVAKGAIGNMSKNVAVTHAADGIRVNSIHPGHINTPLTERQDEAVSAVVIGKTALKRAGEASEVAKAVLFLATDDSSYVTGTEVIVDGGYLAQ